MVEVSLDPWATVTLVALRVKVPLEVVDPPTETVTVPAEPAYVESPG